ncbi:MAG: fumarylacetoacetate hydrolase family protein [Pirellulales bacterium]|nr:fumarylacetoacetate hydrolase family protein [Pirellulales bacterium]
MKIVRFLDSAQAIRYGRLGEDGGVRLLEGQLYGPLKETDVAADVKKILAPVQPAAIYCIGLNYVRHAHEGGLQPPEFPVVFMKSPAALQHPGDPIELPRRLRSDEVDYECELAVVIGKTCRNATQENALDYVFGYTCANDVSARDWQGKWGGSQWCRGKTFDTFAPMGPCLVTADEITNPNTLPIRTILNGEVVQDWNTDDMIFSVRRLIEFLSGSTTLAPGTVILTGTPHGIGAARKPPLFLKPGDIVTIEIGGIGSLTNPIVEEA